MLLDETFLITLFWHLDDFCKLFQLYAKTQLPKIKKKNKSGKVRNKPCGLSLAEAMCIEILFHFSDYKNFKAYYCAFVLLRLKVYFPNLPCYSRFIQRKKELLIPLTVFLSASKGKETGYYYTDSSAIKVCHIKRQHGHKVFKGLAQKSKTTTGWFFGFKIHLIINNLGEIMSFKFTSARTDDRIPVPEMVKTLEGWLFGDKGYLSQALFDTLQEQSLKLVTKVRKNMKAKPLSAAEKFFLKGRGIIETSIGMLKNVCMIEHTRHRSPVNAFVNILSGLVAYQFRNRKPSITLTSIEMNMSCLY